MMIERFFSPKEANELLPRIKEIVCEIIDKSNDPKISEERIKALMSQLEELGCFYKDWSFEIGLVDFPAIIHGQEAMLCWRSDEPRVEWFHGFDDGYAGRRPITRELIFS